MGAPTACARRPPAMGASTALAPLLLLLVATVGAAEESVAVAGAPQLDPAFGEISEDVPVVVKKGSLRASNVPEMPETSEDSRESLPEEALPEIEDLQEEVLPEDLAEGLALVNESSPRRLMKKTVYCICQRSYGNLQCGAMFYSLFQCNPSCPRVCHSKGMGFNDCDGIRRVSWFKRLHYKWKTCPDDPLAGIR